MVLSAVLQPVLTNGIPDDGVLEGEHRYAAWENGRGYDQKDRITQGAFEDEPRAEQKLQEQAKKLQIK